MAERQTSAFDAELARRLALIESEHAGSPAHRDLPRGDTLALAALTIGSFAVVVITMAL